MKSRSRRSLAVSLVAMTLAASCSTGRIYIADPDLDAVPRAGGASSNLVVGVRGVTRMESNVYQDAFERAFEEGLRRSGMFARVVGNAFDDSDVDVVLRVSKANLSYRRQVNAAYFPLALATLTLYIWVGGPVQTDVQYYDTTVTAEDSNGATLFSVASQIKANHWINVYSSEYGNIACRGADAGTFVADLVAKVEAGLRQASLVSADGAIPAGSTNRVDSVRFAGLAKLVAQSSLARPTNLESTGEPKDSVGLHR